MTQKILDFLGVKKDYPSFNYLQKLQSAYCKTVPWESVSRIVRKSKIKDPKECVKLENEFWNEAIELGTGGTCYESNLAFDFLLKALGFETYLTINKIHGKSSLHSAIIVIINNNKYIVDIGYPLYHPIQIVKNSKTIIQLNQMEYHSTYISDENYLIENYPHPKPYLYHLTDKPVLLNDYIKICIEDYGENGLYLDRIVLRKVKNEVPTRFDNEDLPYNIHLLQNGNKSIQLLDGNNMTKTLSVHFNIDEEIIKIAFKHLTKKIK